MARGRVLTVTEFARMGGLAAARKLTPQELSARGRRMVAARWKKWREAQKVTQPESMAGNAEARPGQRRTQNVQQTTKYHYGDS